MSRFQAIGNYVYEKGERIGCTTEESADALACKLNAYQMRIERIKAENERLRKAGDHLSASLTIHSNHPNCGARDEWLRAKKGLPSLAEQWEREKNNNDRAAKEGKPSV